MAADVLTERALNRATLARQLLLTRSDVAVTEAVSHLVGLQAQVPLNPYQGLWARLSGFDPDQLGRLVLERAVVRIVVMRGTIHLMTVQDALTLRPLFQPVLDAELSRHQEHAPHIDGVELTPVLAFARTILADEPRSGTQLRAALAEAFPNLDAAAMAYACRNHLALVQVPPRGVWGRVGGVRTTTLESWVGQELDSAPSIGEMVLRYLGAHGPAMVADVGAWSRLTGLREIVEGLRPRLRVFHDEEGRELFDLPDAPRPGPDVAAPPRFLPEYDNALLSHANRSRFASDEQRRRLAGGTRPVHGALLVDGRATATWWVEVDGDVRRLVVDHVSPLTKRTMSGVSAEGRRLLRFLHPGSGATDVRFRLLE